MLRWNKIFSVVAMGAAVVSTTSFGEGFNPYANHGGAGPSRYQNPYQNSYGNQFQRPTSPGYYGNTGAGTIANGGGGMGGVNSGYNPHQTQNPYQSMFGQHQNMMFNPYTQPYMNTAPWGQYGYNQNQYTNPWTGNWNNGFGNTMMNPYFGSQFQQPYYGDYYGTNHNQSWMYNNGIPGLGYDLGGLGTDNFYDWGLGGYGNQDFSPYLGDGGFNYDNYGVGLGYGDPNGPYDYYGGGFGGGDIYGSNFGYNDGGLGDGGFNDGSDFGYGY